MRTAPDPVSALCRQACPSCSGLRWCARPGWCLDVSLLAVRFTLVSAPAGGRAVHRALGAHVCAAPFVAPCHMGLAQVIAIAVFTHVYIKLASEVC